MNAKLLWNQVFLQLVTSGSEALSALIWLHAFVELPSSISELLEVSHVP